MWWLKMWHNYTKSMAWKMDLLDSFFYSFEIHSSYSSYFLLRISISIFIPNQSRAPSNICIARERLKCECRKCINVYIYKIIQKASHATYAFKIHTATSHPPSAIHIIPDETIHICLANGEQNSNKKASLAYGTYYK